MFGFRRSKREERERLANDQRARNEDQPSVQVEDDAISLDERARSAYRPRPKRPDEAMLDVFGQALYPSLGYGLSGRGFESISAYGSYVGISGLGFGSSLGTVPRSHRTVERMLKCQACGVQYLLRDVAERVDNEALVKLICSSCGGELDWKK